MAAPMAGSVEEQRQQQQQLKKQLKKFPKHLVEIYDIDKMLGQGAFSTVWRCVHRATAQPRAVKKIDTSELSPREIAHEIALMRLLRHENVVKCYDVFLEAQYVNIVVDIFTGGDLVDGLNLHRRTRGRVPDRQLAVVTRQMVAAITHVHSLQIVHRDVKGENFLSDRPDIGDPDVRVALSDFGTAVRIEPKQEASGMVGTPAFWAPEIFAGRYDFRVDVWAVGVTVFILLTGALPFDGKEQICKPEVPGKPSFGVPYYSSQLCTSFIGACLVKDRSSRPRAVEIAQHAWISATSSGAAGTGMGTVRSRMDHHSGGGAGRTLGMAMDLLGQCIVGCCSCLGFCMDFLLSAGTEDETPALTAGGAAPDRKEVEKEVTELARSISISSNKHDILVSARSKTKSVKMPMPMEELKALGPGKVLPPGSAARPAGGSASLAGVSPDASLRQRR